MGRKTHSPVRERKDYTWLLLELQGKVPCPPSEMAVAAPEEEKELLSPYCQCIMGGETGRYLYSRSGGKLHDKSCPKAQDISDDEDEKLQQQREALYADYEKIKKQVKEYDVI